MYTLTNISQVDALRYKGALRQVLDLTTEDAVRKVVEAAMFVTELEKLRYRNEQLQKEITRLKAHTAEAVLPTNVDELRKMGFGLYQQLGGNTADDVTMRGAMSRVLGRNISSRRFLTKVDWENWCRWCLKELGK